MKYNYILKWNIKIIHVYKNTYIFLNRNNNIYIYVYFREKEVSIQ